LVKLASKQLLRCWVSMLRTWEVCLEMQHHRWRRMKIYKRWFDPTRCVYAQRLKMARDVKNWDWESSKASWTKQLTYVLDSHESKMIHGR
jgi:hypothetical protein